MLGNRIQPIPSVNVDILYRSVNLLGVHFCKNPPVNEPFKTFFLQPNLKMTRTLNYDITEK